MKGELLDKITSVILFLIVLGICSVIIIFSIIAIQELFSTNEELSVEQVINNMVDIASEEKIVEEKKEKNIVKENPINKIKKSAVVEENNYSNIEINKYFYNQLEEKSKIIYRAFESNKEQMKTGTYKIALGSNFSDILAQPNGKDKLGQYYQSAIEAYTYDNEDVFYLSPRKMYINIETTTKAGKSTYNVYINSGEENNYLTDEFNSKEEIEQAISQIEEIKEQVLQNRTGNSYIDIKMVHDYLVNTINYESTISKSNIYNIYGALINKECVCEGYARAFKYLLKELEIQCILVIGTATNSQGETENHAWNYVQLDDKWYAVDVTWDDPVIIGGGRLNDRIKYKYFLVGADTINKDHIPSGQFTQGGKIFEYPSLSNENYNV